MKRMLLFDSAYCHDDLVARKLQDFVTARDQGDFFDRIVNIHALAGLQFSKKSSIDWLYGAPICYQLDMKNTLIEGKLGRSYRLRRFQHINHILSLASILKTVLQLNKENSFSVIRAEDALLNGFLAWLTSSIFRLPLIIGVWGNSDAIRKQTKSPIMPRLFKFRILEEVCEKFLLRKANIVLVGNDDNYRFVTSYGVKESKVRILPVVYNLAKPHYIEPSLRESLTEELSDVGIKSKEIVVCISRLEPVKLVDHAIRAVAYIDTDKSDFHLLLVGDGSARIELELLAKELGVGNRVHFFGNQDQEWISRMIKTASVVVYHLTGRALAESALGAAAIVAYEIEWHSELIETGKTGELVPYLNFPEMGAAIERLLLDSSYRKSLGQAARKMILEKMKNVDIATKMNSIYREIL